MNLFKHFIKLYQDHRALALLQWAYFAIAILSVLIAGVFALINQSLGINLLIVPLVAFIAMSTNIIVYALIRLAAETFTTKQQKTQKKK